MNSRAAAEAGVDGEFKLEDFTYTTSTILEALSGHLSRTNFSGITVRQRIAWQLISFTQSIASFLILGNFCV